MKFRLAAIGRKKRIAEVNKEAVYCIFRTGGAWKTFASMAEAAMKRCVKEQTLHIPLAGGELRTDIVYRTKAEIITETWHLANTTTAKEFDALCDAHGLTFAQGLNFVFNWWHAHRI